MREYFVAVGRNLRDRDEQSLRDPSPTTSPRMQVNHSENFRLQITVSSRAMDPRPHHWGILVTGL